MKQLFLMTLALLIAGCATAPKPKAVSIVDDNRSIYQIVLPDQYDNPGTERQLMIAARYLQNAFLEGAGARVPIVKEAKKDVRCPGIYIGNTASVRAHGFKVADFKNFDSIIAVRDGNIYLAGSDRHGYGLKKSEHHSRYILGSVKAVATFMEDYLGTCFAYPGEVGVSTPKFKNLELPEGMTRNIRPILNYGMGRGQDMMYDYVNNNLGRGSYFIYGGHSYYDAVPEKKYGKSNPEYFAFIGGKRNPAGNHLCITNPDVRKMVYAEMLKRLDAGAEIVELAQTDGYRPCECPGCVRYGNTNDPGEKLWIFHRELAEQLKKDRPDKKVMIISYGPTEHPPKSFKSFPDNVMVEICHYSPEAFDAWKKIKVPQGFTVYIYTWGTYARVGYTPKRTPEYSQKQVKMFVENNVRGVYRCGFGENMGLEGPNYYVYGKLFDNPDQDVAPLLDKFYRLAFQEAAGPMRVFYTTLFGRLNSYSTLQDSKDLPLNPRIILAYIYSPDVLDILEKNLERAESLAKSAKNAKVQKRLELVRAEFEYTKNLASIIHLYNAYRINPTHSNFEQLAKLIDARNTMIDKMFDAKGRMKSFPGWSEIFFMGRDPKTMVQVNGRLSGKLGAPFTWNTKLLRDKNILPGVGKKELVIKPASGKVTMDFQQGAWAKLPWHDLGGIQLGEVAEKTRFKVTYDDKNIYFGIESDLPGERQYSACGEDGPCWGQDCLELVLDPKGSRDIYYHFIYNPVAESRYEAAFGLITDVLDPRYNQTDPAWNGKWSYDTRRVGNRWFSLVTIPFKTLGVDKPAKGTRWTMNIGREAFLKPKSDPELSLWSPNLETMSFHDRDSFGEAVFE